MNITKSAIASLILLFCVASVTPAVYAATPPGWDVSGVSFDIDFVFTSGDQGFIGVLDIDEMNLFTGAFTGSLRDEEFTCTYPVTGTVSGSQISFLLDGSGDDEPWGTLGFGTIAPDGSISGTAVAQDGGEEYTFTTTDGLAEKIKDVKDKVKRFWFFGKGFSWGGGFFNFGKNGWIHHIQKHDNHDNNGKNDKKDDKGKNDKKDDKGKNNKGGKGK